MHTEKVGNENSVIEIITETPTLMTAEKLTKVNTNIPDYIVNKKSKKFHFPDCYSVSTIAVVNNWRSRSMSLARNADIIISADKNLMKIITQRVASSFYRIL